MVKSWLSHRYKMKTWWYFILSWISVISFSFKFFYLSLILLYSINIGYEDTATGSKENPKDSHTHRWEIVTRMCTWRSKWLWGGCVGQGNLCLIQQNVHYYLKLIDYKLGSIKSKAVGPEGCPRESRAQAIIIFHPDTNFLPILAHPGSVNLVL